ncbi:copper radical oxidase [Leucosporidium creatinivorum]|uniref:Copper radical oxidase n=1 Tax=Leucosporidium creatinivorum TaxID=106004 RepID=A0A1Y2G133_9BASI|nr:copper radical oxidase [Leucosporidium creatinivorum]
MLLALHTPLTLSLSLLALSSLAFSSSSTSASSVSSPGLDTLGATSIFDLDTETTFKHVKREHKHSKRALGAAWTGTSSLERAGVTGVGAMQASVVGPDQILLFDKAENNPLIAKNGKSAWGSIYTISTGKVRALNRKTNSFCAGGGWLSNGTLVSTGGNPVQSYMNDAAGNGLDAIRLFTPCDDDKCDVYENPSRIRLTSARWYPSTVRLEDGSLLIMGGMVAGGFNNAESTDNPTFEFFPPKNNGLQFYSKFLHARRIARRTASLTDTDDTHPQALNSNLFPIAYLLPDGNVFVAANRIAMIYNWKTNTERRVPGIPNGVTVTYPASAANTLLPLTIANNWTPEVLICGGTPSSVNLDGNPAKLSSAGPTSKQCIRMVLNSAGIKKGWAVEQMAEGRVMSDALLMPDGKVLIINGAKNGIAGYGNVPNSIGASNARNPIFRPTLYDPVAKAGSRFSTNFPSSKIERLYHSSATLIPDGRIFIAGSNPNDAVSTTTYKTRFQVEMLSPPYKSLTQPNFYNAPSNLLYGKTYTIGINVLASAKVITAVIMDLGYSTHGVHMNSRLVELVVERTAKHKLQITAPKNAARFQPGWAWLWVLADGVPSETSIRVMVGTGADPPSSAYASKNLLAKTKGA